MVVVSVFCISYRSYKGLTQFHAASLDDNLSWISYRSYKGLTLDTHTANKSFTFIY